MGKPLHPKLSRFKNARVVFHGKFAHGVRERLSAMTLAQGGEVLENLDATVTHLVLPDAMSGATVQKKANALRKEGAAIEVLDAAAFQAAINPTPDELLALLQDGKRGAKALAIVAPPVEYDRHGAAPGSPRLADACLDGTNLSGLDLRGLAFERCSFVGGKLDNAQIAEAIECDFSEATGESPHFGKINCSRFANARLSGAKFCSHLNGSDFTGAWLDNCTFSEHFWASGVTKRPSDEGPCFRRASLRACLFDGVLGDGANFSEADLNGAAFNECRFDRASFCNAKAHDAIFVAIYLRKADLSNASLVGANLAEADLTGAKFGGADLTDVNLRGAKFNAGLLTGIKGVTSDSTALGVAGPAIAELDSIFQKAKRVVISFQVGNRSAGDGHVLQITAYPRFASLYLPDLNDKVSPKPLGCMSFPDEILQAGRVFGHLPVRFETLEVESVKASKRGKALRDLLIQGIAEAFGQEPPSEEQLAATSRKRREKGAADRQRREQAKAQAAKEKEQAKKQIAKQIEKTVGKVSDVASFLKALEVRIEKPKIDKATKMLKASGFKLFNDVTDEHISGVVKSQTDPDLVYACRVAHDGQYSCCTQNLNVCGGLRGSICKHALVLIIGLVQAGELDPTTIDGWIAKTHSAKPQLDKETMGAIFIKYKGAEAGEVDWRPTETVPEDYYAL